jgi:hypothetical protein
MKQFRPLTTALLTAAALAAPSAAHASSDVTVYLALSVGTYAPTGAACQLSVPAGANGLTVLEAATARPCIVQYSTASFPCCGTFVTCIDFVCGTPLTTTHGTYWNMYENGVSTSYGVNGFSADDGDVLGFAYKVYCFDVVCPPDLG